MTDNTPQITARISFPLEALNIFTPATLWNDEMAVVEGVPVSEMLNRSFYEVFENGDKKWLVTYADVALNGNKHILQDYSPEIDKTLTIYCFQPASGYCACVLIPS